MPGRFEHDIAVGHSHPFAVAVSEIYNVIFSDPPHETRPIFIYLYKVFLCKFRKRAFIAERPTNTKPCCHRRRAEREYRLFPYVWVPVFPCPSRPPHEPGRETRSPKLTRQSPALSLRFLITPRQTISSIRRSVSRLICAPPVRCGYPTPGAGRCPGRRWLLCRGGERAHSCPSMRS